MGSRRRVDSPGPPHAARHRPLPPEPPRPPSPPRVTPAAASPLPARSLRELVQSGLLWHLSQTTLSLVQSATSRVWSRCWLVVRTRFLCEQLTSGSLRIGTSEEKAPRAGLRFTGGGRSAPPHNYPCILPGASMTWAAEGLKGVFRGVRLGGGVVRAFELRGREGGGRVVGGGGGRELKLECIWGGAVLGL
ncbi:unnamed protein product [Danaus chrysippus]|uniref:(African queen) hypothetical protein n=1 Tax=Danaus chrysippus TaxID=151541 RepID=A0A8J2Q7P6_9NEOP|nr:unnamed protein product [Danaus chrysippus]